MIYELDLSGVADKQALHRLLAEKLDFPAWYGHNLDALMDCLTDLDNAHVVFYHWQELTWAEGFWRVFGQAAEENPGLKVTFHP